MGTIRERLSLIATDIAGMGIAPIFKEIKRLSLLSREELYSYQLDKLTKMLEFCGTNVPYYENQFAKLGGLLVNGKLDLKRFARVPALTKEIIRSNFDDLLDKNRRNKGWHYNTTGGSTGIPIRLMQDKNYERWNIANSMFYKTFGGQYVGDRELRLWGSERDLMGDKEGLGIRIRNKIYNRKELNAFMMSREKMQNYLDYWNRYRPQWVEAYTQPIYEFAKFIIESGTDIYSPRGIVTSAGTLYPSMRKVIEETFQCPVFDRYGSREVGGVACNCIAESDLHLSVWNNYVEVLDAKMDPVPKGAKGYVYITTLNNFAMPLVRYRIGDIAEGVEWRHSCPHFHMPFLKGLEGREMSVVKTRAGKVIPGEFFIHFVGVVYNTGAIQQFQVIQEDYERLRIKVVITNEIEFGDQRQKIENAIFIEMGHNTQIIWEETDHIPPLASGKYLYIVSNVA